MKRTSDFFLMAIGITILILLIVACIAAIKSVA